MGESLNSSLPALSGYDRKTAEKIRLAYIRFINTYGFTKYPVSRLDVGLYIDEMEIQLKRTIPTANKHQIEDMIYDTYLEAGENLLTHRPCYYLKSSCIQYAVFPLERFTTTKDWLDITNRVKCFELVIRCVIYDFKKSESFKNLLKTMVYCPRIIDTGIY